MSCFPCSIYPPTQIPKHQLSRPSPTSDLHTIIYKADNSPYTIPPPIIPSTTTLCTLLGLGHGLSSLVPTILMIPNRIHLRHQLVNKPNAITKQNIAHQLSFNGSESSNHCSILNFSIYPIRVKTSNWPQKDIHCAHEPLG